jgi:hypothetical protein
MSDMANSDLEKYAKALDKLVDRSTVVWQATDNPQCDHEVPWSQNGGSERYDETFVE